MVDFKKLAKEIQRDQEVKILFELMLLDLNTPEKVYQELFGVDMEFVSYYRDNYKGLWDLPRIFLYKALNNIADSELRKRALGVYNGGWETLDALFNRGTNINAGETAMRLIKISAAKAVGEVIGGGKVDLALVNAAKNMVGATRDYGNIEESVTTEDWELLISEISEKEKKTIVDERVMDALDQVLESDKDSVLFKSFENMTPEEQDEARKLYTEKLEELDKKVKEKRKTEKINEN